MNPWIGNRRTQEALSLMASSGQSPQVLLFRGISGIGKRRIGEAFASMILKAPLPHPDFHKFEPEGASSTHSIESMRSLIDAVALKPFSASKSVFLINEAEKMQAPSSSALLKTLEEPPDHAIIILVSSDPEKLLPTILSRTHQIRFSPIPESEMTPFLIHKTGCPPALAEEYALRSGGSLAEALRLLEESGSPLAQKLLEATSHREILRMIEEIPEEDDKKRQADLIFEAILFHTRKKSPNRLEAVFQAVEQGRKGIEQNLKLQTVLEALLLKNLSTLGTD